MASGLQALVAKYGSIAVGTYLSLSFTTFCLAFIAIENHLDVEAVIKRVLGTSVDVETTLQAWGLSKADSAAEGRPTSLYQLAVQKAPSVALALLCSKALIPLKVPLAAALTPAVARMLEARGIVAKRL